VVGLNAANEVAVAEFLDRRIAYTDIPAVIERVLEMTPACPVDSIDDVERIDRDARDLALAACAGLGAGRSARAG